MVGPNSRDRKEPPMKNLRVVLCLKGDPLADLSPNVCPSGSLTNPHGSRMRRQRLKKKWQAAATAAWLEAGSPTFDEPVRIRFDVRRKRRVDPDNALAGLKAVIDGLTTRGMNRGTPREEPLVQGMLPDDGARWVSYDPVEQLTGGVWGQEPHLYVVVEPRLPAEIGEP